MPCTLCGSQFTIFKRKRSCASCHCYYCNNCLGKHKKTVLCPVCEKIHNSSKSELMDLKTKELIFFLQSRKVNISGIVEKEELCNLIIHHIETRTNSSSSTPNNYDFDNYAHSFDQIKQTCQSLFTSLSDKITSDLHKTTCFNQSTQQNQNKREPFMTIPQQQARPSVLISHSFTSIDNPSTSSGTRPYNSGANTTLLQNHDCDCSDDELEEISEKRQSIFHATGNEEFYGSSHGPKKPKQSNSSSVETSSFEEVAGCKQSDDDWQIIDKHLLNDKPESIILLSENNLQTAETSANIGDIAQSYAGSDENQSLRKLVRRRSESSIIGLRKSSNINLDTSLFNTDARDVKKIKISCRKCGKAKTKIKQEILKLSEQLKSSNHSDEEIKAKIDAFMDYLESKSQPQTETEDSQIPNDDPNANIDSLPHSASHDEIEENIFDENEGINVYATENGINEPSCSTNTPKRFISLDDISSSADLEALTVKQLKEILMLNRVDFKGCCEKKELKERVTRLWENHKSVPPPEKLPFDDLCKICMAAPIEVVFLECGHTASCTACGKILSECPICRSYIVRIVRIFKS